MVPAVGMDQASRMMMPDSMPGLNDSMPVMGTNMSWMMMDPSEGMHASDMAGRVQAEFLRQCKRYDDGSQHAEILS